ncbi:MAG TPA: helix-turn-helix domain-containing protein, partial [Tepidisphaeraceae bacterium]|nr:helix-turn-helix domain-containing protein [Tepidisphaeraceae bacterium]
MAQRFTSLEEAAGQLGISKERLSDLREAGKVRAYRDGASWKFRAEDIEKLAVEGIPQIDPPPSDLSLDLDDEGEEAAGIAAPAESAPVASESELRLADDEPLPAPNAAPSELSLDDEEMAAGPASDLSMEEVDEPTVAGMDDDEGDALALDQDDSIDMTTDSILLSEAELGESPGRPPSTIIGKAELDLDADLDLSPLDKGAGPASDVRLADESELVAAGDDDLGLDLPSPSGNFEGLEELEVDLEAESSRILAPEDVAKAQAAAAAA